MSTTLVKADPTLTGERADIQQVLANARHFLRYTARDLTDAQATARTTVSELTIGGLIKHVSRVETQWARFIVEGKESQPSIPEDLDSIPEEVKQAWGEEFIMLPGESLDLLLEQYEQIARRTDELLTTVDLDAVQELPYAPWFVDKQWSARRTFMHIATETAQHSGHADIIRESLDGAKSMG